MIDLDKDQALCDRATPLFTRSERYSAYYYGFNPTGVEEVDAVLREVAQAGKAFHHTSSWTEVPVYGENVCCAEKIQIVANESAEAIRKLRDWQKRAVQWLLVITTWDTTRDRVELMGNEKQELEQLIEEAK